MKEFSAFSVCPEFKVWQPLKLKLLFPLPCFFCVAWLFVSILLSKAANDDTNGLKLVLFKQGFSLLCPEDLKFTDTATVQEVTKEVRRSLETVRPKLTFSPNAGTILGIATDEKREAASRLQIVMGPPEGGPELKDFTPEQTKLLSNTMFDQVQPVFAKAGIKITKRREEKIIEGLHLPCFVWGYEFLDASGIPQISLRHYYYLKSATFVMSFSCSKKYFDKNEKAIETALRSLNTSDD